MNNVLKLVKVGLLSTFRGQVGKKRKIKKPLIAVLVLIWFAPLVFSFSQIIKVMYDILESFGQGDSVIALGLLVASMVVFIFGIFYSIGSYYMAKDIPTYLHMPLKSWEISSARFIIVLMYEYLTMLVFFLPVIIGYGIAAGTGVGYYLMAVPVFIALPILPLCLASILIMGIMSFAKRAINKDRFTMIASLLGLGIGIGINIGFQSLARSVDNQEGIQQLVLSGKLSMAEGITKYFPGLVNASKALTEYNIFHLFLFIIIALAAFMLFIVVSRALYFKGVLGMSQQVSRRKFDADKSNGFEARSPVKTYLSKELKLIFRTPIYFMNLVLIDILLPVMILIPMFISLGSDQVKEIKNLLTSSVPEGIFVTGAFILFLFISAMNGITATTISREGKQLYIMKYIPIGYKKQMDAKLLSGMTVSMGGMLVLLIIITVVLNITIPVFILMLGAGINAVILTRLTGMFIDASNPKLKWDNEQKAVKQNINLVFNMLAGMGVAGLAVIFLIFIGQSLLLNSLVFIGGILLINIGLYKLLCLRFPKMIERIE